MPKTLIEYVASKITGQSAPAQKAAAAGNYGGANSVGRYYQYVEGTARNNAILSNWRSSSIYTFQYADY